MTLLGRPSRPLARKERAHRDDRLFLILTDDTYAPRQYFEAFRLTRVQVQVVPPSVDAQAAEAIVARLKELRADGRKRGDVQPDDEFWVVLDTDHYVRGSHVATFSRAIAEARAAGIRVAISNPCFELWLLLHVAEPAGTELDAKEVEAQLREALGGSYNKTNVPTGKLHPYVETAVSRARSLDEGASGWPQQVGTQVHFLIQSLFKPR